MLIFISFIDLFAIDSLPVSSELKVEALIKTLVHSAKSKSSLKHMVNESIGLHLMPLFTDVVF